MTRKKIRNPKKILIALSALFCIAVLLCCLISVSAPKTENLLMLNKTFTVNIPTYFTYDKAEYVLSDEISQHYTLMGQNNYKNINGFIQVRSQSVTLSEYLKQSEENFSASVYDYDKKPVSQNGNTGFDISFKIKGTEYDTQVMQSLWQRDHTIYLISTSARIEKNNVEMLENAFQKLKNSVTLTGGSLPSGKLTEYCIHHI